MAIGWPATAVQWAIILCIATPFILVATRWLPFGLAHRFNATAGIVLGAYALGCSYDASAETVPVITGVALIVSALVFVLGFWGVLTRGYSVALLIALNRLGGRASTGELEKAYSAGRGLRWLAGKRLEGLVAARAVVIENGQVTITPSMGAFILRCCVMFQACFRLRDYG